MVDGIQIARDIIFLCKDKYKWANHIFWLFFFEAILMLSLIFTWAGPISLLPTFASAIIGVALYLKNQKIAKSITLVGEAFFIAYYALLINVSDLLTILSLLNSCTFTVSAIIGLANIFIKEYKAKKTSEESL